MLFVLNCLGVGGSEIKIIKIANALAASGVSVELAYLNEPDTSLPMVNSTVRVTNLGRRGPYSLVSLWRLWRRLLAEESLVVTVNLYPLLYTIPGRALSGWSSRKYVSMVNTTVSAVESFRGERLYLSLLKLSDLVVFGCNAQRESWLSKHRAPTLRAHTIYNGVDCDHFLPQRFESHSDVLKEELGISSRDLVIGSVGRLDEEKNYDLLLSAVHRLRQRDISVHLVLAGRGADRARLEGLAESKGIGHRVHFLGVQSDVRPVISTMDIFVLPSRAIETFSNAALEAMAMKRPVVLSQIGGAMEMVDHGRNGLIFPIGDLDALCRALEELCNSPSMRKVLGEAARAKCLAAFSFDEMVLNYRNLQNT